MANTRIKPGRDPDDNFFVLDGCRDILEEMGWVVHAERYKDTILHDLPDEFERA